LRREQRTLLPPGKIVFAPPRSKSRNVGAVSFGPGVLAGCGPVEASVRVYSVRNKPAPRDGCWHFPKRNKRKSWRRGIIPARDHLYVVTTNLDAQRTAIWDMGKIAVSGDGAIFLFLFFRSWRSWSQRWSIAPLTSGSARRWRSRALCCQAAPASKQS
jgi:hypothetical protein